jgi:DNA-binding transcriptional ArsR family regulator
VSCDDSADAPTDRERDLVTDAAALASLAHPLRLRLLGLLRVYGPSTATKLAQRCGESSGLTSYHLRQLAAAGFVVEAGPADVAEGERTGGRERWWKASQRFTATRPPRPEDEAAVAATTEFLQAVLTATNTSARSWLSVQHTWPQPWQEAADFSDDILRLTVEEAERLVAELTEVLRRYRRHDPSQRSGTGDVPSDAAIVAAQFRVFPFAEQKPPDSGSAR